MITLEDLLKAQTEAQIASTILGNLKAEKFPTDSWASTSVPVGLVNSSARALQDAYAYLPKVAKCALVKLSSGDFLTIVAASNYLEERKGATFAVRNYRLIDTSGTPTVIAIGQLLVRSADGRYYRNTAGGTLPASGTLDLLFRAEGTGTAYNADVGPWTLGTTIPGVTVTHLALITAATDEQSDQSLQDACVAKWSTLGAGANDDAYRYHATHTPGVSEVVRVKVRRHYPAPGQVTLVLAGASATVGAATVAAVQAYIDPPSHLGKAPTCVDVFVAAAAEVNVAPIATVYRRAGYAASISAAHAKSIPAIAAETDIGGTAYRAEFIQRLMDPEGVVNVTLTNPAADTVLAADQVLVISSLAGITYVDV